MKKLLNISVIAALAVLPVAANAAAADVDKQPTSINMQAEGAETTASNATATAAPKYELVTAHATDSNVATAGYVKGAYNAAIRAINKVSETASNALTANGTATLTNKTIDADDNTISDLKTTNFASGVVVTEVGETGSDTALPTEQAVREAITTATDGMVTEKGTQTLTNKTISGGTVSGATITGGTIDADSTTISNLDTGDFKASAIIDQDTDNGIRAATSASDTALVTEKAVATAIEGAITDLGIEDYATQDGVKQTVSNAINGMSATVDLSGLDVTNAAVGGTATASINVMDTWGATEVSQTPVVANVDLSNTMTAVTLSGDSANQEVTLNKPATVQYAEPTPSEPEPANP